MGKEVVQGIFTGLAMVALFVVVGNYVGANLGHGGGHEKSGEGAHGKKESHGDEGDKGESHDKGEGQSEGDKGGGHDEGESHGDKEKGGEHGASAESDHSGAPSGWGGYVLGLLLHVLLYGIPSYLLLGVVGLSEYFDRADIGWWRAYLPGYNLWALMLDWMGD